MIDVGLIDRVGGGIGIHDVLMGAVIKGEGFKWFSVVRIRLGGGGGVGSPVGVSVGDPRVEGIFHG